MRLVIDDFGSGASSLVSLKHYPIDAIKIDQSFVADLGRDRDGDAICSAMSRPAHSLGLCAIAEGVETLDQFAAFRALGASSRRVTCSGPPVRRPSSAARRPSVVRRPLTEFGRLTRLTAADRVSTHLPSTLRRQQWSEFASRSRWWSCRGPAARVVGAGRAGRSPRTSPGRSRASPGPGAAHSSARRSSSRSTTPRPTARTIDLAVARRPASDPDAGIGCVGREPGRSRRPRHRLPPRQPSTRSHARCGTGSTSSPSIPAASGRAVRSRAPTASIRCSTRRSHRGTTPSAPRSWPRRARSLPGVRITVGRCSRTCRPRPPPRPRPVARRARRQAAQLPRQLVRQLSRCAVRDAVPGTGPRHGARRRHRSRAVVGGRAREPGHRFRGRARRVPRRLRRAPRVLVRSRARDAEVAYDALRARAARAPIAAKGSSGRLLNERASTRRCSRPSTRERPAWPGLADALPRRSRDASDLLARADSFVWRHADGTQEHVLDAFWAISCLDGPAPGRSARRGWSGSPRCRPRGSAPSSPTTASSARCGRCRPSHPPCARRERRTHCAHHRRHRRSRHPPRRRSSDATGAREPRGSSSSTATATRRSSAGTDASTTR